MPKKPENARQKALNKISTKVYMFYATETYVNSGEVEEEGRRKLEQVVALLTEAGKLFAQSDAAAEPGDDVEKAGR